MGKEPLTTPPRRLLSCAQPTLGSTSTGHTRHKPGGEPLRQHWTEDRRHEHQHKNHVEHAIVEQTLIGCAQRIVGDQRRSERGRHLRQCKRPHRQLFIPAIAEGAAHDPGGDPFADEQSGDDAGDQQEQM